MAKNHILRVARGTNVKDYSLNQDATSIGRSNENVIILDDENVSRRHAVVNYIDGKLHITDLGSSNGTLVNGAAIKPDTPCSLTEKDIVNIGGYMFTIIPEAGSQSSAMNEAAKPVTASKSSANTVIISDTHIPDAKSESAVATGQNGLTGKLHLSGTRVSIFIGLAVLIIGIVTIVIFQQRGHISEINDDIALSLTAIAQKGLDDSSEELTGLDNEADDLLDRLFQIEYLISDSMIWVEHQVNGEHASDNMFIEIDDEGLEKLKNERYQVTELSVQINVDGYGYTLDITDPASGQTKSAEVLQNQLFSSIEEVERRIQQEIDAQDRITSTLNDVLSFSSTWTIKKSTGNAYAVDGQGLGWSDKLTSGIWKYDTESLEMIAQDQQSNDLNAILSGK